MLLDGFILGFLATASLIVAMFFLRFWTRTRDSLFLAFALAFFIEAISRTIMVFLPHSDTATWVYVVRLCTYLLILAAILRKNFRRPN